MKNEKSNESDERQKNMKKTRKKENNNNKTSALYNFFGLEDTKECTKTTFPFFWV